MNEQIVVLMKKIALMGLNLLTMATKVMIDKVSVPGSNLADPMIVSPHEVRDKRLKCIRSITLDLMGRINAPKAELYRVNRDFTRSNWSEDMDIRHTGYGIGFRTGLIFKETERRLVEFDCEDLGNSFDAPLNIEIFGLNINEQIQNVLANYPEINSLFGGVKYVEHAGHISEFDQQVDQIKAKLGNLGEKASPPTRSKTMH